MESTAHVFEGHLDQEIIRTIAEAAAEMNKPAYIVGGWVRDILLGRPGKDIDVVVAGSGIELASRVAEKTDKKGRFQVFKNFGTAMLRYRSWEIEFVGARKESYRADSRKPVVEDGSLDDDMRRRDFTINAMAVSLNKKDFGTLLDPFQGIRDLEEKMIRTPLDPDITYSDDPLRMMRAIRFATQLHFEIAPESFEAIRQNAERLNIVSVERVMEEFNKIMLADVPGRGLKMLRAAGLLPHFFPELEQLHGVEVVEGKAHKDNFFIPYRCSTTWLNTQMTSGSGGPPFCTTSPSRQPKSMTGNKAGLSTDTSSWGRKWFPGSSGD